MAWNGWKVVDMDSHIVERPHEMYGDHIDPEYREKFERLKRALEENVKHGQTPSVASSRHAVIAPIVSDNTLGEPDSFGMVPREFILNPTGTGRVNFGRPERGELPQIDPAVSWDVQARLAGMDASHVDIDVLFPTHVSSYCALHDVGFESALYRAYHRWVRDFCAQAPTRLKWTVVPNMRDPSTGAEEIRDWAKKDTTCVGVYLPPCGPNNMLLDDHWLDPIYQAALDSDLPVLVHGGTARPPYQPGTFDLRGTWFLQHSLSNPWAGMAALGALVGGGIFERFPGLRVAVVETAAGWLPSALERFDAHYYLSPGHVPLLKRLPSEVVKQGGSYFHGVDTWERTIPYVVEWVGEDVLLFASDWPHGDTAFPEAVQQIDELPLSDSAKRKILGENAMRLCPRLRD